MGLLVITGGSKRLGEGEKYYSKRGRLDLCQGGPGLDPEHGVRDSHPPREEAQGDPYPGGYPNKPEKDGPKVPRPPSWENLIHAPRDARGSGPPLPLSAHIESGGGGAGVALSGLPSQARGLEGACPSGGVQANATSGDNLPGTHPSGVM